MSWDWRLDLKGLDLSRRDLRNADLRKANLTGANLAGADLRGADLTGSGVMREVYSGSSQSVDLSGALLDGANLRHAWLHYANLFDAAIVGADLRGADLEGANLQYVMWTGHGSEEARANLEGARLVRAQLTPRDTGGSDSGFLQLANAKGLETVDFGDPSIFTDYVASAFKYIHDEGVLERSKDPRYFAAAVRHIQSLAELQRDIEPSEIVVQIVTALTARLIAGFRENPDDLHEMPWDMFEDLIAELLASFGWKVTLTPRIKDGGFDIFGISPVTGTGLETSWIIDCKRWAPDRPVGIGVVRALYAVKSDLRVANALVATTSTITSDASDWAAKRYDLSMVDLEGVVSWLNSYRPNPGGKLYIQDQRLIVPPSH